jgi:hypothetical protein
MHMHHVLHYVSYTYLCVERTIIYANLCTYVSKKSIGSIGIIYVSMQIYAPMCRKNYVSMPTYASMCRKKA